MRQFLTIMKRQESDKKKEQETFVLVENQSRRGPLVEWSSHYLSQQQTTPIWTDREGQSMPCKEDISLPGTDWFWVDSKWLFATPPTQCDETGWQYALGWETGQWKPQSSMFCRVRRRIWKRTCSIKPTGYVEPQEDPSEFDDLLGEFELLGETKPLPPVFIDPDSPEPSYLPPPSPLRIDIIAQQEQEEQHRKQEEAAKFEEMEKKRKERASESAKQREVEQGKLEQSWNQQQLLLQEQLERDRQRLALLQNPAEPAPFDISGFETQIHDEQAPEDSKTVTTSVPPSGFIQSTLDEDEFSDEDFEAVED